MKQLNRKNLVEYLTNTCTENWGFSDEEVIDNFVSVVLGYVDEMKLNSYKEIVIYIDGLLTPSPFEF